MLFVLATFLLGVIHADPTITLSPLATKVYGSDVNDTDLYIVDGKDALALFLETFWFTYDSTLNNIEAT